MLAGGASRRLGGLPKGLELVGKQRIIDRVASSLRAVTDDLLLATNDLNAGRWLPGVAVVSDLYRGSGGLAGVEAALRAGRDVLVVAWDMPFVTPELLRLLLETFRTQNVDLALPASLSPYGFEPFCAVYSARLQPSLTRYLENGGGAAGDFIGTVPRVHRIALERVERTGDPRRLFFSVNTPADLELARAMAEHPE